VLYPGLPEPDAPVYEDWAAALREMLVELGTGERVLVCHSLSCLLWFRCAPSMDEAERVDRLLLVAPPDSARVPDSGSSFRLDSFNADAVERSCRGSIRVVSGEGDPYNPLGASLYVPPLEADVDVLEGGGHISEDDGFGPWPAAFQWCLDPEARLAVH
jgi:predicted alpha/beta hydrolase family esterase